MMISVRRRPTLAVVSLTLPADRDWEQQFGIDRTLVFCRVSTSFFGGLLDLTTENGRVTIDDAERGVFTLKITGPDIVRFGVPGDYGRVPILCRSRAGVGETLFFVSHLVRQSPSE
jgi:hypothetical protein